jgi:hypothetical protein
MYRRTSTLLYFSVVEDEVQGFRLARHKRPTFEIYEVTSPYPDEDVHQSRFILRA